MKAGSNEEADGFAGVASKAMPVLPKADVEPAEPRGVHDGSKLRELTCAIRRGDESAFSRFYDAHGLRLYEYVLVLAKGNEAEAKEVFQTTVVKLAKRFEVFDSEQRLRAWLRTVARNTFVDRCRVRQREGRFVPLDGLANQLAEAVPEEHRLAAGLRQALDELPPEDSELVRGAYVDKRSIQDLADERDETYKAVESRLARLRQKLKARLLIHLRHENLS
ncbi:MAG: RNA polymerase sigma factor [Verrucomicrobia bacterium]|jgi:RNA polymerase sigma-70 factor (ECF subfamily)|nr:RNA polymerase sigma factor [Verrucomicrobiota bacterium]